MHNTLAEAFHQQKSIGSVPGGVIVLLLAPLSTPTCDLGHQLRIRNPLISRYFAGILEMRTLLIDWNGCV
jgi:hypothetical protein